MKLKHIAIIILPLLLASCHSKKSKTTTTPDCPKDTVVVTHNMKYGIIIDSLDIVQKRVKRNEFLGTILENEGIGNQQIFILSQKYKDVFDVRKVRVGGNYELFHTRDSIPQLAYFVYQKNLTEMVIYDFTQDTVIASTWLKEVHSEEHQASGIIDNSLWQTIVDQDENPMLAMELSDIYAWNVDFFGIAQGDCFKVVYDENYVDSASIGIKDIKCAMFTHKGETYYAIPFEQNGSWSYFNEDGESLKRAFLKAPLKYSRISSKFSNRRYHPVLKIYRAHHGVDYAAPSGTPVHSIGDGVIVKRGYQKNGGGNYLKIKHNSIYTTEYMHLKGFASGMTVGTHVKQGQTIGYVGMTGLATGPHLDFRVFKSGTAINPLTMKSPSIDPITAENKAAFEQKRDSVLQELDAIPFFEKQDETIAESRSEKGKEAI